MLDNTFQVLVDTIKHTSNEMKCNAMGKWAFKGLLFPLEMFQMEKLSDWDDAENRFLLMDANESIRLTCI